MTAAVVCEGWLELARAWCELRDSKDHPDAGEVDARLDAAGHSSTVRASADFSQRPERRQP